VKKPGVMIYAVLLTLILAAASAGCYVPHPKFDLHGPVKNEWLNIYQGPARDESHESHAITVDQAGNVYITGRSQGDIATIKYNRRGKELWVNRHPDGDAWAITLDSSGNVYVCGSHIIKYDPDGKEIWAVPFRTNFGSSGTARDIVIDRDGNVVVVGQLVRYNLEDCSVIKYDNNGNLLWTAGKSTRIPENLDAIIIQSGEWGKVVLDRENNIMIAGNAGMVKYDQNGNSLWTGTYGGQAMDMDDLGNLCVTGRRGTTMYDKSGLVLWRKNAPGSAIALDNSGNVYVTHPFKSAGHNSNADGITLKYDSSGNQIWTSEYGGTLMALDDNGIYVTLNDYFTIIKYSYNNILQWKAALPGSITGFVLDDSGNIYATGSVHAEVFLSDFPSSAYATVKYVQE
jgi:hypothetical protein